MTPETKEAIYNILWGLLPYIVIPLIIAAVLGIGYKLLEKKLMNWAKKKKAEKEQKNADN